MTKRGASSNLKARDFVESETVAGVLVRTNKETLDKLELISATLQKMEVSQAVMSEAFKNFNSSFANHLMEDAKNFSSLIARQDTVGLEVVSLDKWKSNIQTEMRVYGVLVSIVVSIVMIFISKLF